MAVCGGVRVQVLDDEVWVRHFLVVEPSMVFSNELCGAFRRLVVGHLWFFGYEVDEVIACAVVCFCVVDGPALFVARFQVDGLVFAVALVCPYQGGDYAVSQVIQVNAFRVIVGDF